MSIVSMTGFGRGEAAARGVKVEVELSSVNRKQFDARINMPRSLATLESRIRSVIHDYVSRGNVSALIKVSVSENVSKKTVRVDMKAAKANIRSLRKAATELKLKDDLTARSLFTMPDVVSYDDVTEDTRKVWRLLQKALKASVLELVEMRKREGNALKKDLTSRLKKLKSCMLQIKKVAPGVARGYRRSLKDRLNKAGARITDDRALVREVLIFADKTDISEEIVRLESHFKQAAKLMNGRGPVGRTLDFLCQEMFREINTIGSKAGSAAISSQVIKFKSELECVREQVQNVE